MAFSFLNGLGAAGASVAQFAGAAGLEYQKSQLSQQAQILADQLATTRETKLQGQQQEFQTKMEGGRQAFQSGENTQNRTATATNLAATIAAENSRNAATIAAESSRSAANRENQIALEKMRVSEDPSDVKAARAFRADPTLLDAVTRLNEAKTGLGSWNLTAPTQPEGTPSTSPATGTSGASVSPSAMPGTTPGASSTAPDTASQSPSAVPAKPVSSANVGDVLNNPKEDQQYSPRAAITDILKTPNSSWNTDVLNRVPVEYRPRITAMLEGREAPPPAGRVNPVATRLLNAAHLIDPTFDESTWNERFKTRQSIASGPIYQNTLALNTALGHIAQLGGQFAKEGNYRSPLINWAANAGSENVLGNPEVPDTRRAIDTAASEIRRALSGSAGGLTELQEWQKNFPINGSPSQQVNAVKAAAEILKVRMGEMTDQVNTNLGKGIAPTRLLTTTAQKALDDIEKSGAPTPASKASMTPQQMYGGTAPVPGRSPTSSILRYDETGNRISP